jgi:hypothetical protein
VALVWVGRLQTDSQARLLGRALGLQTAASYFSAVVYFVLKYAAAVPIPLRLRAVSSGTSLTRSARPRALSRY